MTILQSLYTLLIGPLELFFEVLYSIAYRLIGNPGIAIIFLSLAMNFLVLPLYMRADAMQNEQIEIEKKLQPWIKHIKRTFKGDERFMMLQAYYRQNNYKPTQILRSSVSLFLEIPFFIAAFKFLSNLDLLNGVSFGPIADLGQPDGLIVVGSISINLLPILMTLINIVSSAIYTKDAPLKSKIQLYGIALIFLVFLYRSPAGLVFYWTLNNLFSLIKNIFYRLRNPQKALGLLAGVFALVIIILVVINPLHTAKRNIAALLLALILLIPAIKEFKKTRIVERLKATLDSKGASKKLEQARDKAKESSKWTKYKESKLYSICSNLAKKQLSMKEINAVFYVSCMYMAVLCGILIPSLLLKASPAEFIDSASLTNPTEYLLKPLLTSIGVFVVWFSVFYNLGSKKDKSKMSMIIWGLAGVSTVNFMFFGTDLGNLSAQLVYDSTPYFTAGQMLGGILIAALVFVIFAILWKLASKIITIVGIAAMIAISAISYTNVKNIQPIIDESIANLKVSENEQANISLSKNGKNVVVIMLDRAIGEFIPYMINEKPELKEQLKGFTYYSNTLSYGSATNVASPALYGGYEYTPEEINKRKTETLESKQNEALKLMPVIFDKSGYEVTVCDPTYAGYAWIPDLSIYDDYPDINTYITKGIVNQGSSIEVNEVNGLERNFFCYSIFRIAPDVVKGVLYNGGVYNEANKQLPYGMKQADSKTSLQATDSDDSSESSKENATSTDDKAGTSNSSNKTNQELAEGEIAVEGSMEIGAGASAYEAGTSALFMKSYNVLDSLPEITNTISGNRGSGGTFTMMSNDITHDISVVQEPDYTPAEKVDNRSYEAENRYRYAADGSRLDMSSIFMQKHYQSNMAAWLKIGEWCEYLQEIGVYDNTRIIVVSDHGYEMGMHSNYSLAGKDLMAFNALLMVKDFNSEGFRTDKAFMTNADVPTLATQQTINNPVNPFTGKAINNSAKNSGEQHVLTATPWQTDVNNGNVFKPGNWFAVGKNIKDINNWKYLGTY